MFMRFKLFILAIVFYSSNIIAQKIDTAFKKDWILIDSFINKDNLTKTALAKVNAVYTKAKQRQLPQQAIKALIYKMELEARIKEDNYINNIKSLTAEIEATKGFEAKAILYTLLAKQYENYYQSNQWNINQRTQTLEKKKNDVATWSKDDFTTASINCYQNALQHATVLQKTMLENFDVLIIYGTQKQLRPTLFDVLAHEALEYFKTPNYNYSWRGNGEQKNISNPKALATENEFLKTNFAVNDSLNKDAKALQLFQQLIAFHKKDKSPDASIDIALERIIWVNSNANFESKNELYIKALTEITTNHTNNNIATQGWFLLAKYYSDRASLYKPFSDTAYKMDYTKAIEIINERLKVNNDTCEGNSNMRALKKYILQKTLSSKVEAVNVPDLPFRMLLNFKNVDTLFYRIVKLNYKNTVSDEDEDYNYDARFWKQAIKKKPIRKEVQILPKQNDFQQHNTEIKIDALQAGSYAIIGSTGKDFVDSTDNIFYQTFTVSSIAYIKNNADYFIVDRETGKPLENVNLKIANRTWNSEKQKYTYNVLASYKGDETSKFSLKNLNINNYYNTSFIFSKGNDTLITTNNYYYNQSVNNDTRSEEQAQKDNAVVHFFTDRSIYRPGQTVFFKGIITTKTKEDRKALLYFIKQPKTISLRDVNGKQIDSAIISQNEFGSFNGQFKIPMNVLTGNFSLRVNDMNAYTNFSVEEYKRPKFYVEFEKQKNTYKLNDSITVTGSAKAFAGNNIDGAKVNFTVTRNARFENYWMFWRNPQPASQAKQIANGEIKTSADGKFKITFKAEPDAGINKSTQPIFDFSITASVTDINGETREGNATVAIGYQSTILKISVAEKIALQDFTALKLTAENLAGEAIAAKVNVSINSLQLPDRLIRQRYWDRPDVFVMDKNEYIKNFPYDEYDNETDRNEWKNDKALLNDTFKTVDSLQFTTYNLQDKFHHSLSNASPLGRLGGAGIYKIIATTTDKDGQEVKAISYVELFDKNKQALSYPQYISQENIKIDAKAGDTAVIGFSTASDVYLIKNVVTISNKQKEEVAQDLYTTLQVNNNAIFKQNITENNKAGIGVYFSFIKNNRFYNGGSNINFIEPSKKLKIIYGTYRNKTLPGSKETYSLKVSGENGEKVAAELLTAMYDASLDEFKYHNWNEPYLNDSYTTSNNFASDNLREKSSSSNNYTNDFFEQSIDDKYSSLAKSIDELSSYSAYFFGKKLGTYYWKTTNQLGGKLAGVSLMDAAPQTFAAMANNEVATVGYASKRKVEISKFTPPKIVRDEEAKDSDKDGASDKFDSKPQTQNQKQETQIRKNFNETAFFFPNLYADTAGNYTFSFTMPEALTKWKWLSLAHTKDLHFGLSTATVITTKPLMVQPNTPRFLREADVMELTAKIANTTDKEITGTATLELIDATTGNSVDGLFTNVFPLQYFTVAANQSSVVKFPVQVPMNFAKPLTVRIVAISKTGNNDVSDGEENTLPVLTNKIFLTESLPIYVKANESSKVVDLKPLFNTASNKSGESMTIEYTSNPVWSVVQALPYLMEYPYECAEQTFNKFFANAMAASIVSHNKNIQHVIEKWKADTTLVKSKLQQNEELKALLLSETPWVLDAESEVEQQKRLALLLDLDKMQSNINTTIDKLQSKQLSNGAFSWFDGGRENDYITQYIVTGIGKLKLLDALSKVQQKKLDAIATKALLYLDSRIERDYKKYITNLKNSKNKIAFWGNSLDINYWYMRTMFLDNKLSTTLLNAKKMFVDDASKKWMKESVYMQAMIATSLNRFDAKNILSKKILNSIKENAVEDTAKGTMYWKQNHYCYYWYQNNFETQALLIQAYAEQNNSDIDIEKMKTWLLLNKQTNSWKSTISTSAACYALLSYGTKWMNNQQTISIGLPNKTIETSNDNGGYVKQKLDDATVNKISETQNSTIVIKSNSPLGVRGSSSYGAVYYQYFSDVNDVKSSTTNAPLTLVKKLFIEKNNSTKKVLQPVNDNDELNVGDKLIVRIELRCDRQMEFLHLKDMRAANTEPVNVLSQYKWQDGLGYYESTRDASTNFFIDNMQRGTYVFEYPLYITHSGNYSVGLASIQCMYAPEFTSHSNGIKIRVK